MSKAELRDVLQRMINALDTDDLCELCNEREACEERSCQVDEDGPPIEAVLVDLLGRSFARAEEVEGDEESESEEGEEREGVPDWVNQTEPGRIDLTDGESAAIVFRDGGFAAHIPAPPGLNEDGGPPEIPEYIKLAISLMLHLQDPEFKRLIIEATEQKIARMKGGFMGLASTLGTVAEA